MRVEFSCKEKIKVEIRWKNINVRFLVVLEWLMVMLVFLKIIFVFVCYRLRFLIYFLGKNFFFWECFWNLVFFIVLVWMVG